MPRSSEGAGAVTPEPRSVCERCLRPRTVCVCADITPIATRTRVLILQHPRERDVGLGTARLARLGLASAVLRTDVDFSGDPVVRAALAAGNAYVLYPGKEAIDVATATFESPITLIVLDGTWWQAHKLLKANPALAALPRLALVPAGPSVYGRIRREPAEHCVATLEAIALVLGHLEGDPARFAAWLRPLHSMVSRQLHFATEVAANRHHRTVVKPKPRDPIPAVLRERSADLVCVHGEANAWPCRHPERTAPEIVHWLARRLPSGETFESVMAPRGRLAPSTCHHIRLSAAVLAAGESWGAFAARFHDFLRPRDVLVSWGHFPLATLAQDGWQLEHERLDARAIAGNALRRRTGAVEECAEAMHVGKVTPWAQGRGGARLASLCAVVERLGAWPVGG